MDPEKFGAFVALCRKEKNMTQLEPLHAPYLLSCLSKYC